MERHLQRLPRGMPTAQEPAHVYRAKGDSAMSGDLAYLGLAEAAELIRAKKLSPVEYVTALLARIERYDAKYNAFIALTPERALKAARAAEAEISGRTTGAGRSTACPMR